MLCVVTLAADNCREAHVPRTLPGRLVRTHSRLYSRVWWCDSVCRWCLARSLGAWPRSAAVYDHQLSHKSSDRPLPRQCSSYPSMWIQTTVLRLSISRLFIFTTNQDRCAKGMYYLGRGYRWIAQSMRRDIPHAAALKRQTRRSHTQSHNHK